MDGSDSILSPASGNKLAVSDQVIKDSCSSNNTHPVKPNQFTLALTNPSTSIHTPSLYFYREASAGEPSVTGTKGMTPNGHNDNALLLEPIKKSRRDERRRATHNEVERRRRDKINTWIMKLGSIIPETCEATANRQGPVEGLSKGGILAAACEYITDLKEENDSLSRQMTALCETSQTLMEENSQLQQEKQQLLEILQRHGLQYTLEKGIKDESPILETTGAIRL